MIHLPIMLITLALGYWVLTKAAGEKAKTKTAGQIIAWVIIVVSLVAILTSAYFSMRFCVMSCHNKMMGKKSCCSMMQRMHKGHGPMGQMGKEGAPPCDEKAK